jgi:hypothetical protein
MMMNPQLIRWINSKAELLSFTFRYDDDSKSDAQCTSTAERGTNKQVNPRSAWKESSIKRSLRFSLLLLLLLSVIRRMQQCREPQL